MATEDKRNNRRFDPGAEGQIALPLDSTVPIEDKKSVCHTTDPATEDCHACPGCGSRLKRWKGCWICDNCGYSSCGEAE